MPDQELLILLGSVCAGAVVGVVLHVLYGRRWLRRIRRRLARRGGPGGRGHHHPQHRRESAPHLP